MSTRKLVTCPETSLLQRIEYVTDREGDVLLVIGCTAYEPTTAIECAAPCGDRLDARRSCARER